MQASITTPLSNEQLQIICQQLQQGKPVILCDDHDRENEGDLIYPAQFIEKEDIAFMLKHTCGIICFVMTKARAQALHLPLMVTNENNNSRFGTAFTVSVDAAHGIASGVSAADRAQTIAILTNTQNPQQDLVKPGHIFPLIAHPEGLAERQGHTEGSLALMKLAGCKPCAILCELMHDNGEMMRGQALQDFAKQYDIPKLSIAELCLLDTTTITT